MTSTAATPAVETREVGNAPRPPARDLRPTARTVAVCMALTALCFSQRGGLIGLDTKMDLYVDPGAFLARAMHLWDPDGALGRIQNQAYGYFVPMGPFFALTDALQVPAWIAQRAWMSVLLCAAYLGVLAVCRELRLGGGLGCHVAALAFALAPRVTTLVGTVSAELLPTVLLPWAVVPLIRGLRGGSLRRCAATSGVAVLLMGGANAAAVVTVLVLPAVLLVWHVRSRVGRRLLAWWTLSVALATTWWVVSLLLMGRFGINFLPFTETAAVTTRFASPASSLRGTTQWVAFVSSGGMPWWPAAQAVAVDTLPVLAAALLAGLGLAGLATWRSPWRRPLLSVVVVGMLLLGAGHLMTLPGPFADQLNAALDGALSPLRNTHKFDVLVRLPLAVGLAALLSGRRWDVKRLAVGGTAVLAVATLASPAVRGELVPPGAYEEVPAYWHEAADFLNDQPGGGAVMVVPGAPFGEFVWGRPLDEPLQALLRRPWVGRSAVVLGSTGVTRLVGAVDDQLARGEPSAGLAEVLARSGIQFVVLRNDLDRPRAGAPPPRYPLAALEGSPGIARVAEFGEMAEPATVSPPMVVTASVDDAPAVVVYEVASARGTVGSLPLEDRVDLAGGPEALLGLAERGELAGRPVVVVDSDHVATQPEKAPLVVTDTARRQEVQFSRVRDNVSATMGRLQAPARTAGAVGIFPDDAVERRTTERWFGVGDVRVSSSAGDPDVSFLRGPGRGSWAALDGREDTFWSSNPAQRPVGQWVEVRLDDPADLSGATVSFLDGPLFATVTRVSVQTDSGRSVQEVTAQQTPLQLPPGRTESIRVTVEAVTAPTAPDARAMVALQELSLPGVEAERSLEVPTWTAQGTERPAGSVWRFVRDGDRSPCVVVDSATTCDPRLPSVSEERGQPLDRTFTAGRSQRAFVSGTVTSDPSIATEQMLTPAGVVVTATSRLVPGTGLSPVHLLDGDPGTAWAAAPWDDSPAVSMLWSEPRTVSELQLVWAPAGSVARPTTVVVEVAGARFSVPVGEDGMVTLPAVSTSGLRLELADVVGPSEEVPVGLAEIRVPALDDLVIPRSPQDPLILPCGAGPTVLLDGRSVPTEIFSTVGDIATGRPAAFRSCDGAAVDVIAGEHRVLARDHWGWTTQSLAIGELPPAAGRARTVEPVSWGTERRTVRVAAGEAAVLTVAENAGDGWVAALDGRPLEPLAVDGWRQGWVVPAGDAGIVELWFRPGLWFRVGLVVGLAGVLLLLALALRPDWTPRPAPASSVRVPTRLAAGAVLASAWLLAGLWGVAAGGVALLLARLAMRPVAVAVGVPGVLLACGVASVMERQGVLPAVPWPEVAAWLAVVGLFWAVGVGLSGVSRQGQAVGVRDRRAADGTRWRHRMARDSTSR